MADGGSFTQTGLAEMKAAIARFPEDHTARLRAVAAATADRLMKRSQAMMDSHGTGATAARIGPVQEDKANQQFLVISRAPKGAASNLPWLLEYGTIDTPAFGYMRKAADAEEERYRADMEAASVDETQKAFAG